MIDKIQSKSTSVDHLKYSAKLLGKASLSFLKINLLGQISIFITCIVTIFIAMNQMYGNSGVNQIVEQRPITLALVLLNMIASPFLLFSLGNKYVMTRTINRLISDKGEDLLFPIIDRILNKVKANQPQLLQKGTDKAKLQLRILQEIKDSKENKWMKKIIIFGLKKVDLNEVDFKDENVSFTEILKTKIIDKLKDISEPSRLFFYLILGWQALVLLLTVFRVI